LCGTQSFVLRNERELQVSWKTEVTKTLRLQKCEVYNSQQCTVRASEIYGGQNVMMKWKRISLQDGGTRTAPSRRKENEW